MLATQVFNDQHLPLMALPSARIPDPGLKPSKTQSTIFVTTKSEFEDLPESIQQGILQNHCILVLDIGAGSDPGFTIDTIARYRNPYVDCIVHGTSLRALSMRILIVG